MSYDKLLDDNLTEDQEFYPSSVSSGIRFANRIIDVISIYVFSILMVFLMEEYAMFIILPFILGYYVVLEGATGKTLGKMITGCRVVDEYGNPPGYATAALRSIIRIVPLETFSIFFGDNGRMWHDEWSKTYVVKDDY